MADTEGRVKLGVSDLPRAPGFLSAVYEDTYVSPNGVVFLKVCACVRRMLFGAPSVCGLKLLVYGMRP